MKTAEDFNREYLLEPPRIGAYILTFTTQELRDLLYMARNRNDSVQIAYNPTTKTWQSSFGPLHQPEIDA